MFKVVSRRVSRQALGKVSTLLGLGFGVYFIYFWRLGSLTPGLSPAEATARQFSGSLRSIIDNPLNFPLHLLQYGLQSLGHHTAFFMRLPSVFFMLIFLGCFYYLVRNWFGRLVGLFGTLLLVGAPWLILIARSADDAILLLSPLVIIFLFLKYIRASKHTGLILAIFACSLAISLYIPGMIWFVVAGGLLQRRTLTAALKKHNLKTLLTSAGLSVLLIIPLLAAVIKNPSLGQQLLLIPDHWSGLIRSSKDIAWSGLALFWHSARHTDLIVNRLPLLDFIAAALALSGAVAMWLRARKEFYELLIIVALSIIFSGLNNNFYLLIPAVMAIYIFAAAGLRYLYMEWRQVFPHNPLPKILALSLIVLVVGVHLLFGIRYALVAWPHTNATHQIYVVK